MVQYGRNFTCIGTFLTYAYISNPTRNCHNKNQLRWDHVTNILETQRVVENDKFKFKIKSIYM